MKYSLQRDLIFKYVEESYDHPTADMIYERVRKDIPNISLGTVYRNLNLLSEMGKIKRIIMPGTSDRFDKTLESHSHIYCINCNKVDDIMIDKINDIDNLVSNKTGYEIISHDIVFVGICSSCKNRKKD